MEDAAESLRYRKKLKSRIAIERAALELVIERDYDGMTVEDICMRADVSKKTFFNYFSSKAAAITGRSKAFPDHEQVVEILEEREDSCYIDVLVDIVGADFPPSVDEDIARLRLEALRSMPQLFFQGQRDVLVMQRSIAAALRIYLVDHSERRMIPDQPIEHEVLMATSAVIGIARTRSMMHVCYDGDISAQDVRHLLIAYLSADQVDQHLTG